MKDYEKMELNSCYNSYLNRCMSKKIIPISKTKFRFHIENQMPKHIKDIWFHTNAIKRYIKENFKNIQ
jgi:hypothetical protein